MNTLLTFFTTFKNDDGDTITSDNFRWKDIPHWDSISLVNEPIEIEALKQSIQEILPLIEFEESGNTIYMTIPTEEEINKEIKNSQNIINKAQKKLEKLKKSIQ